MVLIKCGACKQELQGQTKLPLASCPLCGAEFSPLTARWVAIEEHFEALRFTPKVRCALTLEPAEKVASYREASSPNQGVSLEMSHFWIRLNRVIPLSIVTMIWNLFLVFWYTKLFDGVDPSGDWWALLISCVFFIFPLLHVAFGLGLIYFTIVSIFNATKVTLSDAGVHVTHGPIPTFTPLSWQAQAQDIKQLLVRRGLGARGGVIWKLIADVKGESLRDMIGAIQSRATANAVESMLEELLGIVDDPEASDRA